MKTRLLAILFLVLAADMTAAEETWRAEISHLLAFIETSDCTFSRNGRSYPPVKAREHIGAKYDYLKNRIDSAEQFIVYSASKSSITGEKYTVTCDGVSLPSEQWLTTELHRFREKQAGAATITEGK